MAKNDDDLDGPWKQAIELFLPQCLELFAPWMHAEIDWAIPFEFHDKDLPRVSSKGKAGGPRIVDKLAKVRLAGDGSEAWVLIHVEVQNQRREDFSQRMFRYFARLREKYPDTSVVSLAILGDTDAGWRPDRYDEEKWKCSLVFRYPTVKLADFAGRRGELEAMRNPAAAVVLAHLAVRETKRDPQSRLSAKLALARNLTRLGYDASQAFQLLSLIDWLLRLPEDLDGQWWEAVAHDAEENDMTYVPSFERRWKAEGKAEGKEEGKAEGIIAAKSAVLADWVRARFGDGAEPLATAIGAMRDAKKLDAVQNALRSGSSEESVRNAAGIHG